MPRQFMAHPPAWGSKISSPNQVKKVNRYFLYGIGALVVVPALLAIPFIAFASRAHGTGAGIAFQASGAIFLFVVMGGGLAAVLAIGVSQRRSKRRGILICVTNEALTVDERPGDVYSFLGAKLGRWGVTGGMTMGTALHLQSGTRRFILGGRNHRLTAGTRLGAPDVCYGQGVDVDAWVSAADFDEILDVAGRRSRLDVGQPAPEAPIRCLLFPNPMLIQTMGMFAHLTQPEFLQSINQPRLAIDLGTDGIWVNDPNTNSLFASAWAAQVTATLTTYKPSFGTLHGKYREMSTQATMTLSGPGLPPLSIACGDSIGGAVEYRWRGNVPVVNQPADYMVSGADWHTLVERFGLAPQGA